MVVECEMGLPNPIIQSIGQLPRRTLEVMGGQLQARKPRRQEFDMGLSIGHKSILSQVFWNCGWLS